MNKLLIVAFLILLTGSFCCDNQKDCDEDNPICHEEKCVECTTPAHCDNDKYCKSNECVEYEDSILGEFCNYFDDIDCDLEAVKDAKICGKCDDDEGLLWEGVCLNFECVPCTKTSNGIVGDHPITAKCYPVTAGSAKGKIGKATFSDGSPNSFMQDSIGISFLFLGLLTFLIIIVNCVFYFKQR
ncbi:hypothetical protein M0812_05099 [Anaeramoeba flamelloides]|uniref:Uncharacterized protein n=1 Tax=Anaeramoeba flamelloides TaxID=1746091 RepID=A0AAV8AFU1_9EUKA|nr:hypothetical protein M0812_05099 [Anaeramoeba flamelloides]|eukprot:Anaeramoba_flamelloidesa356135_70.p1 GENE.a356135_70~~a356135_70.p1  ORF type:complete len:185 (-),score=32.13 a356135_70:90-644(-)